MICILIKLLRQTNEPRAGSCRMCVSVAAVRSLSVAAVGLRWPCYSLDRSRRLCADSSVSMASSICSAGFALRTNRAKKLVFYQCLF